jgi:PAS domain S-box-containing protein
MKEQRTNIEEILESILRGAAKILGCISANLVVFNKKTQQANVRVGIIAEKLLELYEIEELFGNALQSIEFPFGAFEEGIVYASWKDARIYETSSLSELVGRAFSSEILNQVSEMIGNQRFICVPVVCGRRRFGVIIFTKEDLRPFGLQRREILLRYAQRIGEIIENELRGRHSATMPGASETQPDAAVMHFLFDEKGKTVGKSRFCSADSYERGNVSETNDCADLPGEIETKLSNHASQWLGRSNDRIPGVVSDVAWKCSSEDEDQILRIKAEFSKMPIDGKLHSLCTVFDADQSQKRQVHSGQTQLLQFALGDTAPAVLVDPQFNITSYNEATERLFGYKPNELLHRSISILFREAKEIYSILNHQFLFLSDGYFEDVVIVRRKNGQVFPGKIEALLLADENHQVIGFLVLIHDQSGSVSASQDGDSMNHLMRMERLATMGEVAAQLAHEIRNPLVSIGATLEMLTKDDQRKRDNWEILKVVAKEVTRMDMILKDYLSLAARRNVSVAVVDLGEIINDALRLLEGTQVIEGKKISSTVATSLNVLADYDGLRHVFHNLFKNALEATSQGSQIECHASVLDDNLVIHIDDHGVGLASRSNECFKPFFTTKANGTGLGLAVCEKIIESHGGTISLKNRREGGCRASVVLPQGAIK